MPMHRIVSAAVVLQSNAARHLLAVRPENSFPFVYPRYLKKFERKVVPVPSESSIRAAAAVGIYGLPYASAIPRMRKLLLHCGVRQNKNLNWIFCGSLSLSACAELP